MPTTIRRLTTNGLEPVAYSADSLSEAANHEPDDGIYTVANTVDTYNVLKLTAHLNRLQDSAQRENIALSLTHKQLRSALREVIDIADYGNVKFRITIPRITPDEAIISVEPFPGYPESLYTEGVAVVTAPDSARKNAAAKGTWWMTARAELKRTYDAYEIILMNEEEHLLEGTGSNFYAILRDTLYTAKDGVLPGISQQIVFEVAPDVLPLVRRPASLSDLPALQEAFITSSSRGIVPIVKINETRLGDGTPGPYTRKLMTAYSRWVSNNLERI
jgi:branched-chain amino acid aminotransferase